MKTKLGPKIPTQLSSTPAPTGKKGAVGAQKVTPAAQADRPDAIERNDASKASPDSESPLTQTVFAGLGALPDYQAGPSGGEALSLQIAQMSGATDAEVAVKAIGGKESLQLAASQIARDTGLSPADAQALTEQLVILLAS